MNNRSIFRVLTDRLNLWVALNYLVLTGLWIFVPWVVEGSSLLGAMCLLWIVSGPVYLLNATGQMCIAFAFAALG